MTAYYNEIDEYAAQWLRNLISARLIADGDVDERDIRDVKPIEVQGYDQCHFFAGIGVWSHVLRRRGWPDTRRAWTGSCPCQPFSAAGKGGGFADERHLWPAFFHLIQQCEPPVVYGEQVASPDGLAWIDLVQSDLEGSGNSFGAFDLCAAGFGAPHIRQRLFWVGYSERARLEGYGGDVNQGDKPGWIGAQSDRSIAEASAARVLANADGGDSGAEWIQRGWQYGLQSQDGSAGSLADASGGQLSIPEWGPEIRNGNGSNSANHSYVHARLLVDAARGGSGTGLRHIGSPQLWGAEPADTIGDGYGWGDRPGPTNGFWRDADWLLCRDERWRPVRPGSFPLVNGATARMGRLRAYGNAIVAPVAEEFVSAWMECKP